MNALKIITGATGIVVSMSTSTIIINAVKATSPAANNLYSKVAVAIGGAVVSSMVGDAAAKYVSDGIEKTVADVKKASEEAQKSKN